MPRPTPLAEINLSKQEIPFLSALSHVVVEADSTSSCFMQTQTRALPHRWRTFVALVPLLFLITIWGGLGYRPEGPAPRVATVSLAPILPPLLRQTQVATIAAPVNGNDVQAAALTARIQTAMASMAAPEAAPAGPPVMASISGPDPKLLPRQAPLTAKQLGRLSVLRWQTARQMGGLAHRAGPALVDLP